MKPPNNLTAFLKFIMGASFCFLPLLCSGQKEQSLPPTVKSMVKKADQHYQQGNYDSALNYYDQSLAQLSANKQTVSYVKTGNKKLFCLLQHPEIIKYKPFSKKLLNVSQSLKSSQQIHYVRALRLNAQTHLKNVKAVHKGRKHLKKAKKIHDNNVSSHFKELAYIYNYLGLAALFESNFTKCQSYLDKAFNLIEGKNLTKPHLSALNKRYIGHVMKKQGYRDSALKLYKKGFKIIKKAYPNDHPVFSTFYYDLGVTFRKLSKLDSALSKSFKALTILRKNDLSNSIKGGLVKTSIGSHYYHQNDMQKALVYHKRSLNTFDQIDTFQILGSLGAYNGLGIICRSIKYHDKSERFLKKGINLANNFRNPEKVRYAKGALFYNIGKTFTAKKEYGKAIENFKKAIKLYKDMFSKSHHYLHTIRVKLSKAYELNGSLKKSIRLANSEEAYFEEKRKNQQFKNFYFSVKGIQASVLRRQGNQDSAVRLINHLLKLNSVRYNTESLVENPTIEQITNKKLIRNTGLLDIKARSFLKYYETTRNNQYLKAAFQTYMLLDSIHKQLNQKISLKRSRSYYKRFYGHHFARSIYTAHRLLKHNVGSEKDRQKYLKKAFYFNENAKASILMESLSEKAVQYSKALPDSVKDRIKHYQKQLKRFQRKINNTSDSFERYQLQSKKLSLQTQQKDFYDTVQSNFPNIYKKNVKQSLISLDELKPILRSHNKNLVAYTHQGSNLFAMVITHQTAKLLKLPNGDSLNNYINKIRDYLIHKQKFPAKTAHKLYQSLIKPLKPYLTNGNVVVAPEGKLGYLPFGLLLNTYKPDQNARNYNYLIKDYAFSYTPSATLWAMNQENNELKAEQGYIGFAPSFSQKNANGEVGGLSQSRKSGYLGKIPNAKKEIQQAIDYWNGKKYIGQKASEHLFKQQAPGSSIIHLATHGFIDDQNPANNRLLFNKNPESGEDGILYTYELYDLNLNADLAVLSACNTGVGKIRKGSGIMSLAKGFKVAGCENILMTLWSVNDKAGANLIDEFYSNLKMGYSKEEALRKAKLAYIKENDAANANPYYWAGFVLMGSEKAVRKPDFDYNWIFFSVSSTILLLLVIGLYNIRNRTNQEKAYD